MSSDKTSKANSDASQGLRTFNGVYLPSILTILGVIMYLRLGYVVGSVRLIPAMAIIILSSMITLLTALSIATCVTNMKIKGGGAYYLISRAFGKELGGAIGLPLYFAQAIGIAFYTVGFVESLAFCLPNVPHAITGIVSLVALTILAYTSTTLALRAQGIIFIAVIASLVSFFAGTGAAPVELATPAVKLSFWPTFALFFPAVTGIETGIAMSGDLKNPSRSLVIGTLSAVVTGLIIYLAMAWFLSVHVSRDQLLNDPFIVLNLARWKWMVMMGLWGATLSSALGGILGAPRTLQALAKDGIVPHLFGKGFGPTNAPRIATVMTFAISAFCISLGRLDVIAPILTMFFLISYGMLNLAAGLEGLTQNPSWRPSFRVPVGVSLIGAGAVMVAMFMIDPGATFLSLVVVITIYYVMARRKISEGWDDIRQGLLFLLSRFAVYRLANATPSARAWRPNFLVFTEGYSAPENLLHFTADITRGKGFLTVASVFPSTTESVNLDLAKSRIKGLFQKKKVEALVAVTQEADPVEGIENLIDSYGIGPLSPNTVVVGDSTSSESVSKIPRIVTRAIKKRKNVIVIVGDRRKDFIEEAREAKDKPIIDIWWDDSSKKNSELMLVLAHMHQRSAGYGEVEINLKCTVSDEAGREQRQQFFNQFFSQSRLSVNTHVYVADDDDDRTRLKTRFSANADIVLLGLRTPEEEESQEDYATYYRNTLRANKHLDNVAYALAVEPVDMNAIFA